MEAIVLAGSPASGKTVAAGMVAQKLGITKVMGGTDILKQMAIEKGYKPGGEEWWDSAEGMRFLEERKTNQEFDKETDRRMAEIIKNGNAVVTSYTAPWIVKEGFKVWLAASKESRAERMAKRDHLDIKAARAIIDERDEKNRKLYMALYKIDFGHDTKPFHLVVETDEKTEDEVVQIILDNFKTRNEK